MHYCIIDNVASSTNYCIIGQLSNNNSNYSILIHDKVKRSMNPMQYTDIVCTLTNGLQNNYFDQ